MPPDAAAVRLGQRLRKARLARNLTQSEVAQQRFSVSYISAVERGQIRPSLGALEKLSERLRVPLSDLLRDDGDIDIPHAAPVERSAATEERDEMDARLLYARILARQGQSHDALESLQSLPTSRLTPLQHAEMLWRKAYCYLELRRPEDARSAILEAIPLAEKANNQELVERLRLELGNAFGLMHKYQLALDAYKNCKEAIDRGVIEDPVFRFVVLYNIGSQYRSLGDFTTAIEILKQAAETGESVVNPSRLGALYATLCESYLAARDFPRARLAATQSMESYKVADNIRIMGEVHTRLGSAFAQSGQLDEALENLEDAYQIAEQEENARGLAEAERGLAAVYVQQKRIEEAATAATHALALSHELDDAVDLAESLLMLADVEEAQEDFSAAEKNFKQATDLLDSTDAIQARSDAYARYSEFLERRGQGDKALKLLRKAWQLSGHSPVIAG
jgi:tetratricopeptide (TPR) repeat protein